MVQLLCNLIQRHNINVIMQILGDDLFTTMRHTINLLNSLKWQQVIEWT